MGKLTLVCEKHNEVKQYKNDGKGGKRLRCQSCTRERSRRYFHSHKESYRDYRRKGRAAARKFLQDAKAKPCSDCGVQYPYYVMEFDHRPGEEKKFLLSHSGYKQTVNLGEDKKILRTGKYMGSNAFGKQAIEAEISKCDVVCSNCHRERTHQRRLQKLREKDVKC